MRPASWIPVIGISLVAIHSLASAQELPTIGFVSPAQGEVVTGPDVTVQVEVFDFALVPPSGTGDTPGQGHILYFLDFEPPFIPGQPAIPDDPNVAYAATHETSYTFQDVRPGSHDVFALLVLDSHAPAFPPAIDKVSFALVAPGETPEPQPTPVVTETARSIDVQPDTPLPTPEPSSSPSPAVLPVQMPPTGSASNGFVGLSGWLLVALVVGGAGLGGLAAVTLGRALMNRRTR
jgi:hypothetical protein